jgi:hypothetical protein
MPEKEQSNKEQIEQLIAKGRQTRKALGLIRERTQEEKDASLRRLAEGFEEARLREARVSRLAAERDLRRDSQFPGVWLPKGEDVVPGQFPSSFITHEFSGEDGEQIRFREHEIEFPISNPGDLAKVLSSITVLYERGENAVVIERRGVDGLVNFVKKVARRKPRS